MRTWASGSLCMDGHVHCRVGVYIHQTGPIYGALVPRGNKEFVASSKCSVPASQADRAYARIVDLTVSTAKLKNPWRDQQSHTNSRGNGTRKTTPSQCDFDRKAHANVSQGSLNERAFAAVSTANVQQRASVAIGMDIRKPCVCLSLSQPVTSKPSQQSPFPACPLLFETSQPPSSSPAASCHSPADKR